MCEKLSYQIINTLAVSHAVVCYYEKFWKIIIKKETLVLVVASKAEMNFLNSCKTCLAKRICVDFCKSEILNINICNWYKVLYPACNIIFGISTLLDHDFVQLQEWSIVKDRQLCLHKYLEYWVLCPIIA